MQKEKTWFVYDNCGMKETALVAKTNDRIQKTINILEIYKWGYFIVFNTIFDDITIIKQKIGKLYE